MLFIWHLSPHGRAHVNIGIKDPPQITYAPVQADPLYLLFHRRFILCVLRTQGLLIATASVSGCLIKPGDSYVSPTRIVLKS